MSRTENQSTNTLIVLPHFALGHEYYAVGLQYSVPRPSNYSGLSKLSIISAHANTTVQIKLVETVATSIEFTQTASSRLNVTKNTVTVTLNAYEALQVMYF